MQDEDDTDSDDEFEGAPDNEMDLLNRMHCVYRLLELYSERGNSGLGTSVHSSSLYIQLIINHKIVDKVVIPQQSLRRFVNSVSRKAYKSMTRIDFASLDKVSLRPIGVYGSKSEIIKLLLEIGAIDESM